ncbi:PDR/VanB family oxidoreductase [Rhodococcus wratislaviensis]|uniref:PDR/VanB family oxidoreductase n=1 Tax=Rhodococcus wratislaviensis TaxID=44752 RepID=UPI003661345D
MKAGDEKESLTLSVAERYDAAQGVVVLELMRSDGCDLPAWTPGAHIELFLKPGLTRQYSLCGDPADLTRWRVAVLREPEGRGGSAYVHEKVEKGAALGVSGPRNHFELKASPRYIFIAGGIGITPILPMLGSDLVRNAEWELYYGGRSLRSMAFRRELLTDFGDRVHLNPQDQAGVLDLGSILSSPRSNTLVYCCGPSGLLDAVELRCRTWPEETLHVERFQPRDSANLNQGGDFEVELSRTGAVIVVRDGQTVLEAVRNAGVLVPSSCEEGTCGTCEVPVLEGEVDHRDSILTAEEQAANDTMLICVSRAACPRLVLDL